MFSFFKKKEPDVHRFDEQYIKFRNLILDLDPNKFKSTEQHEAPDTWGIMVDIGLPEMFFTVVAIIDGTTSVYTSTGSARLGFGDHPTVEKMSHDLLTMANKYTEDFKLVSDCPLPSKNMIKFYTFKQNGKYMGECEVSILESNTPIQVLFQSQNWTGVMATIAWSIVDEIRIIKNASLSENQGEIYKNFSVKALYIMVFTPEIPDPKTLKAISFFAGDRLKNKAPFFKQLFEEGLAPKTPIEIANHQYLASMGTPETMKASMRSWLEEEYRITFDPVLGKNFFMQGVRDAQDKENTTLFYFDVEE